MKTIKNKSKSTNDSLRRRLQSAGLAVIAGLAMLCGLEAKAQPPVLPRVYFLTNSANANFTNGAMNILTAMSSNINSQPFPLYRDRGFTANFAVYCTNASGSNVSATFQFATPHVIPGTTTLVTNWSTQGSFTTNFPNGGTTEQYVMVNVPKGVVDNATLGRLSTFTNQHTSTLFLDLTNSFISTTP